VAAIVSPVNPDDQPSGAEQLSATSAPSEHRLAADATQAGARLAGLWSAFARSVRDNIVAEMLVQVVRVGGMVYLARVLRPQDFGLLKVLTVAAVFVMLFVEAGIPEALIQRRELRHEHEVTAWWLTVCFSLILATACYFAAPLIASAMGMKRLTFGVRLLCIPILLEGAAICSNARLRRELRFGALAAADVVAEISFLSVALVLLFSGSPAWSLPAGLAARLGVHGLVVLAADARLPLGLPSLSAARDLGRFAATVLLGGNLLVVAAGNADYLLVGRFLGSTALGFYSMAWDLIQFIPARLYRVAGRVAFPAFCQLQDNDHELAFAYLSFVRYIARIVLPIAGCAAIAAPELLESIYGPKWLPAATPLRMLTLGLALVGLRIGIGTIYYSKNYPSMDIYLHSSRLLLIVLAVLLAAPMGLVAVSTAVSMVEAVISVFGQYLVCRLIGMRLREVAAALIPALRLAVPCMVATALAKFVASAIEIRAPLLLGVVAAPPAIVFCWLQAGEMATMVRQAFGRAQAA
jgi:PST family polysaccharide transporter